MTAVLLLGATGRTGAALLRHRPPNLRLYAGVRPGDGAQPPSVPERADDARAIDLTDPARMRQALIGIDVVVNAIRLRGDIPQAALSDLHDRIVDAREGLSEPLIIHVGGAGALRMGGGRRFWQEPAFPAVTLPRCATTSSPRPVRAVGPTSSRLRATGQRAASPAGTAGAAPPTTSTTSRAPVSATRISRSPWPMPSGAAGPAPT